MKRSDGVGYIRCKRLNKEFPIHKDAIPTAKGDWLCPCGRWVHSDPYYHSGMYKGKEIV